MCRFLKYSYSLLLCLFSFACSHKHQEEKPFEIPYTQDDLTQIYSLAFDSLLGPSEQWLDAEPLMVDDSIVIEAIFRDTFGEDYPRKTDLLSEERYWRKNEKALQKYAGFDIEKFKEIIADSSLEYEDFTGAHKINSSYKYKPSIVLKHSGSYNKGEPLAAVALEKVAFNKTANYAMVIGSIYRGPDWSHGNAYFLKKENSKWKVVGVNRLFVS